MDEDDDILADIKSAVEETRAEPVEAPAAQPEPKTDDRPRDEHGRFVAKEDNEPEQPALEQPPKPGAKTKSPPEPEPQADPGQQPAPKPETIQPPANWSAEAKAAFVNADPNVQKQILRDVESMNEGKRTWETKAESFNRLDKVLAPHRERWALNGVAEDQAVAQLLAAQSVLDRNPIEGLKYLARSYNVDLRQLVAPNGQQPQGQAPAQVHPLVQQLATQVQTLQQNIQQRDNAAAEAQQASLLSEIDRFKSDPQHFYYENVKSEMAALIRIGDAQGDKRPAQERLKDAYTRACRANDGVWKLIEADNAKKAKERERVEAAKKAGGSVTGAPGRGQTAKPNGSSNDDLEDDIRSAMREAASA